MATKTKTFTKEQWQTAFESTIKEPIGTILNSSKSDLGMMQHIFSSETFLETLPWIEQHFGYKKDDEVTKGIVFTVGVAVLSRLYIQKLNGEIELEETA